MTKTIQVSESDFDEIIVALICFKDDRCCDAEERSEVQAIIDRLESQRD